MTMKKPIVSMIAAVGRNNELGGGNEMLWHMPNDFKHFKRTTMGHPVIMGRKTFETLGGALKNRPNLVVTRQKGFEAENATVFHDLHAALEHAKKLDNEEVFIAGGGEIYRQGLPFTDKIYLTRIDGDFPNADTFFPKLDPKEWKEIKQEAHQADERHAYDYTFIFLVRQASS